MEHNFQYRQSLRQEKLLARQRAARVRRIRFFTIVFAFLFLFISVIGANAIIADAGQGFEKAYEKQYMVIEIAKGDTVWSIATNHMTPGYETVSELVTEIGFINNLDDTYSVQSGKILMIPYYAEI